MQTYVINLDRAPDRLQHIESQFATLDASFVRVAAVDYRNFDAMFADKFRRKRDKAPRPHAWSLAQIAIYLSHQRVWETIARGPDLHGLVLEDDVHLGRSMRLLLRDTSWIKEEASIIRLETTCQSMRLGRASRIEGSIINLRRLDAEAWGSAAYVVSRECALWLSHTPVLAQEPVDWLLFHPSSALRRGLVIYQADPAPCVQDQYHPSEKERHDFSKETSPENAMSLTSSVERARPLVRALRGRREVTFQA